MSQKSAMCLTSLNFDNSMNPCFCLQKIKDQLESEGFVLIPGNLYYSLLLCFGATRQDLDRIESGSIHNAVERDKEANMSFRQIAFHRMILEEMIPLLPLGKSPANGPKWSLYYDYSVKYDDLSREATSIYHGEEKKYCESTQSAIMSSYRDVTNYPTIFPAHCNAVTQISKDEISSDSGAKVYFDRSATRKWNKAPFDYTKSSVPEAIARLNYYLTPAYHHEQTNLNTNSNFTINDQLLIRINKDTEIAEPTPEGIHQDGTEISSVTLIHRENVRAENGGGESRIWNLDQPIGNYDSVKFGKLLPSSMLAVSHDFSWDNCLFDKALDIPWETIIFNDRQVKHEVRPFLRDKETAPCYRDVIVSFVRKPLSDGSDKRMVNGVEESIN